MSSLSVSLVVTHKRFSQMLYNYSTSSGNDCFVVDTGVDVLNMIICFSGVGVGVCVGGIYLFVMVK